MSGLLSSAAKAAYQLAFQISPIVLVGGLAEAIPFIGMLPIVALTEGPFSLLSNVLSGTRSLDSFFAHWQPMPGATLIEQQIGTYPFANQSVAANATIAQPLTISMLMTCPARGEAGYAGKLLTTLGLQAALEQHNRRGGTYIIATPSFFYTNCVMLTMRDASSQASHQPQNTWQLDFQKPLVTLADAAAAENSLLSKITGGTQINGTPAWSGAANISPAPTGLPATPGVH